jgi:hypothetical protein
MGLGNVVQMGVLSPGYHVDLFGVILGESATPKQQPKGQRNGVTEAAELGEDQDQGRTDRGDFSGRD